MKKDWNSVLTFILIGTLIGILIVWGVYSNLFYELPYSLAFKINGYTEENVLATCSGKSLVGTAFCLNSFIRGIYKYVVTDDKPFVNLDEIKEYGEDCHGYTLLYAGLAKELGFKTKKVVVGINKTNAHTFLLMYNREGYCKLDMKEIDCIVYW